MKLSDYIVLFLINKNITHVFGYPGGMVTHLMDSFDKFSDQIKVCTNYHEQACAFSACGYAQYSHKLGVAYATSGPGATNLMTGIANAYFDSIATLFITGQVNTYEQKGDTHVRQKGFQEMDVVSIVRPITKYATMIINAEDIRYELEKAYYYAMSGRKGPVVLDIPMDIFRAEINPEALKGFDEIKEDSVDYYQISEILKKYLLKAKKPIILAGAGISKANKIDEFRKLVEILKIPVVTSMIAIECLNSDSPYNFGFIGAYGHRYANFVTAKSDLIISIGSRLDSRQTGVDNKVFAENATLIRIDIDEKEISNKIKENEIQIICDIEKLLPALLNTEFEVSCEKWLETCNMLKSELKELDCEIGNVMAKYLSIVVDEDAVITTDVGQNQVWIAQSFQIKSGQQILFSGGHGSMGYSLPAAIGAYYASEKPVICINGDGGIQMNIQELQLIAREEIPIKIIVLNNYSLGMIRHFQEMYFESNYVQTRKEKGYTPPDFTKIANAYGIRSINVTSVEQLEELRVILIDALPVLINIDLDNNTYVYPKLSIGKPIYDQDPLMNRELFNTLCGMD